MMLDCVGAKRLFTESIHHIWGGGLFILKHLIHQGACHPVFPTVGEGFSSLIFA
jgi:hypothetical protein